MQTKTFQTWAAVVAAATRGDRLWYHAPLDLRPRMITVIKIFKNGKLRINGGECTFTADAGHLDRFRYAGDPTPGGWKLIPESVFCRVPGTMTGGMAPVLRVTATPPVKTATHEGTAIRGECTLVTVETTIGVRHYGVADAYINSSLRMAIKLWPGCEHDEVIRRWEDTTDERNPIATPTDNT